MTYFSCRYYLCSDPTEQTVKPHHPRGGARDAVWLSFEPEHRGHDILPTTTSGKCIEQDGQLLSMAAAEDGSC